MKNVIAFILLLSAAHVYAADETRNPFPDDFTPTTCATVSCSSYAESEMTSAAAAFLGLSLDVKWVHNHLAELEPEFEKLCRKMTSCFATPPNNKLFCLDVLSREFRTICDRRFPKERSEVDFHACYETVETYLLGLDQRMQPRFDETRKCAEQNDPVRADKTLDVWIVPSEVKQPAKLVPMRVYAIDRQTRVPIFADMAIEGQKVYAPANPTGALAAGYPFQWPVKFARVKNAAGHEDSIGPTVTLTAAGYPSVSFRLNVEVPRVVVSMEPAAQSLRPRKVHRVTVTVKDALTGEPVTGSVMGGRLIVGATNQPFELDLRKRDKRPEIWITDLSNSAGDYVVAPAGK